MSQSSQAMPFPFEVSQCLQMLTTQWPPQPDIKGKLSELSVIVYFLCPIATQATQTHNHMPHTPFQWSRELWWPYTQTSPQVTSSDSLDSLS